MINKFKNGTAQPNLSAGNLKKFEIPLPSLTDQRRIVGILDEAFEGIATAKANAEENLGNARELFESHLNEVFTQRGKGWQRKSVGDVCKVLNGGTPKTSIGKYWGGKHLWVTPAEMGKLSSPYLNDTKRKLTDLGLRNSSARIMPPYSIILSSRAPIGYLVINTKPMSTNQGCKGLIPHEQLDYKFLYHYLSNIIDLLNSLGSGTTFKELSGTKLKEVPVPVPPLAEQKRIVGILDTLRNEAQSLETIYQKKINALDELKASLLHQAFSGEL